MYTTINKFRKKHRFLGVFIGIQFLFWTISGLYFSWTNINEANGDHYIKKVNPVAIDAGLITDSLFHNLTFAIHELEIKTIGQSPFFWVNDSLLVHPKTSKIMNEIRAEQAVVVVPANLLPQYTPQKTERITQVGPHSEYRGRPLPTFRIALTDW